MLWSFVDMCNDGVSPSVALFDVTVGAEVVGPFAVQPFNQTLTLPATNCITGDQICFGAWQNGGAQFWGCGLNCAQAVCTNCCFTCGSALSIKTQNLTCL